MKTYIMALDQGTTSSRCILFDKSGNICSMAQKEFGQIYPQPGWVEHDPMEIWNSQLEVAKKAMEQLHITAEAISGIGITNQRETTIVWNKETGEPIYNAIVWQCRRTTSKIEALKVDGLTDRIREKTGLIPDAYFSATKIAWVLENVEGARKKANEGKLLFGTVDSWLIWKLTGGKVHITDYTNASRTMLFDIKNLCWDTMLLDYFQIPSSMLPRVAPSSQIYGYTDSSILGKEIPIASAVGDQQAALFGQGCFEAGEVKNTYGTGCFLLMNTGDKRVESKNNLVTGVAWGIGDKVTYAIEGSAFNAGSVIKWLRDDLHLIPSARRCDELAESVPNSNGVYFVPAFTGLGAPYWDMYARGTIVGLTRGANSAHICRSVLEAIAYQMTDLLEAMKQDSDIELSELRVDGGASVSNIMMQIQADMIRTNVNRPKMVETTAIGAAYLAGLATGFWKDTAEIEKIREVDKIFEPQMDMAKREKRYRGWLRAVERSRDWVEHQ